MIKPNDNIIYVDKHVIATIKPSGLLTQSDISGNDSLIEQTRQWVKKKIQ